MGRRGMKNEGQKKLKERMKGKIEVDLEKERSILKMV